MPEEITGIAVATAPAEVIAAAAQSEPQQEGPEFQVMTELQGICAGIDVPYELLSGDLSNVNYCVEQPTNSAETTAAASKPKPAVKAAAKLSASQRDAATRIFRS